MKFNRIFSSFLFCVIFSSASCSLSFSDFKTIFQRNESLQNRLDDETLLNLFDASSKLTIDGLQYGHRVTLGAFDECIEIDKENIIGKYCLGDLRVSFNDESSLQKYKKSYINNPPDELLQFGICVTEDISVDQLNEEEIFKKLGMEFKDVQCYSKNTRTELPLKVKIVVGIISVFVVLAAISTIYDVVREIYGCKPIHELAIAFSFRTNGKKLITPSNNSNQLLCINGLKTLNMIWVVTAHSFASTNNEPIFFNTFNINPQFLTKYSSMLILGASVAVDSFLTITGILTVYTLLRSPDPGLQRSFKGIPMMYLHRYIRLTPALAVVILIYATSSLDYIGNGPYWYRMHDYFVKDCEDYWWSVIIYLENYINPMNMCMMQSWYLSVDMQLFLVTPFILIPLRKYTKRTLLAIYGIIILGFVVPFVVSFVQNLPSALNNSNEHFGPTYYSVSHTRFGPYVIGLLTGYYIYQAKLTKKPKKINPILNILLWIIIFSTLYACIYTPFPLVSHTDDEKWGNSFYNGFVRNIWAMAISSLTYLCVTGNGGPIDWFLSLPIMQLIAKLSYSIYLTHLIVIASRYFSVRTEFYFSTYEMFLRLCGIFIVCMLLAAVFSLLFEFPMVTLEKIIFRRGKASDKESTQKKSATTTEGV